jgi:tetratricopeptide (TPR) repeat protein
MIRKTLIGLLLFTSFFAGQGQTDRSAADLTKARYLVTEKRYAEAAEILSNLPGELQAGEHAVLAMGCALSGLGRYRESNDWLQKVSGDLAADATYLMSGNYLSLGDIPGAMHCLELHLASRNHYPEKRIRLDPAFSALDTNRDWIRTWQKDWYSPQEQDLAECEYLVSQGKADEAFDMAVGLVASDPANARALFIQARLLMAGNESRQAMQMIDRAWNAGGLLLREDILRFMQVSGTPDKVTDLAGQLLRQDPGNPEYLIAKAMARIGGGKGSAAEMELESIEQLGIAPAELYYLAAKRIAASAPRQAEQYLNKALDSDLLDSRFFYQRGLIRISLEKTDEALGDLAMSLDINPNQPDLYLTRATVRYELGDQDGACHDWQKALEMGNPRAADLLYKFCKLP